MRLACRKFGYEILEQKWETEAQLKAKPYRVKLSGKTFSYAPDTFLVFTTKRGEQPLILEQDGGTQSEKVIKKKVRALAAFYNSGDYTKRYKYKSFRVLFVTKTKARMQSLKQWTESLSIKGQKVFRFAIHQDIKPENILHKAVCFAAGESKSIPLFKKPN